jgi:hypothetical protein
MINYIHWFGKGQVELADNMSEGETQLRPRETTVTTSQYIAAHSTKSYTSMGGIDLLDP